MTRKQKRLTVIGIIGAVLFCAVMLVLVALQDKAPYYYEPGQVVTEGKVQKGERFRLGGLVKSGSIDKSSDTVKFVITDLDDDVPVRYQGILPDLFGENQGVVVEGKLGDNGEFVADTVLAKHDENYMPREVAETLKKKGIWQENGQAEGQADSQAGNQAKGQPVGSGGS